MAFSDKSYQHFFLSFLKFRFSLNNRNLDC